MKGGQTIHSLFKLPVPILDTNVCNISPVSKEAQKLREIDLIILDEASMIPTHALHAIDRLLRDITNNDVLFGGKVFLLGGDFRQVLPVVPRGSRAMILDTCLKRFHHWTNIKKFHLTQNMRAGVGEQDFSRWLLKLGNGELKSCENQEDQVEIPDQCAAAEGRIVQEVFKELDEESIASSVILSPKNEDTMTINDEVLDMLPGEHAIYYSADSVITEDEDEQEHYPVEFLNSLTPSGMPPHTLRLKRGAIIMLLRNIDIRQGLCNGTRLIVRNLHRNSIDAEVLLSQSKTRILIPRIKLAPSDPGLPFVLQRIQFPIRLCYSMTINKSQGQTFNSVGLYLPKPVFTHGQLYVAFSRARRFENVKVLIMDGSQQGKKNGRYVTKNVVFKEVLY